MVGRLNALSRIFYVESKDAQVLSLLNRVIIVDVIRIMSLLQKPCASICSCKPTSFTLLFRPGLAVVFCVMCNEFTPQPLLCVCVFLLLRCPDGPRPSTVRPCQLPCKKDCIMTPFSDWTACPVTCDAGREKNRLIICKECDFGQKNKTNRFYLSDLFTF